jgi:hypothetical protein
LCLDTESHSGNWPRPRCRDAIWDEASLNETQFFLFSGWFVTHLACSAFAAALLTFARYRHPMSRELAQCRQRIQALSSDVVSSFGVSGVVASNSSRCAGLSV